MRCSLLERLDRKGKGSLGSGYAAVTSICFRFPFVFLALSLSGVPSALTAHEASLSALSQERSWLLMQLLPLNSAASFRVGELGASAALTSDPCFSVEFSAGLEEESQSGKTLNS